MANGPYQLFWTLRMVAATVIFILVAIVAAGTGTVLFARYRHRDHFVERMCQRFELEPLDPAEASVDAKLRQALVNALQEQRTRFDFEQFKAESGNPEAASMVAEEVYRRYFTLAQIDRVLDRRERTTLTALADVLHLDPATRQRIERQPVTG